MKNDELCLRTARGGAGSQDLFHDQAGLYELALHEYVLVLAYPRCEFVNEGFRAVVRCVVPQSSHCACSIGLERNMMFTATEKHDQQQM